MCWILRRGAGESGTRLRSNGHSCRGWVRRHSRLRTALPHSSGLARRVPICTDMPLSAIPPLRPGRWLGFDCALPRLRDRRATPNARRATARRCRNPAREPPHQRLAPIAATLAAAHPGGERHLRNCGSHPAASLPGHGCRSDGSDRLEPPRLVRGSAPDSAPARARERGVTEDGPIAP